ncbi:hypothetical protein ASESINO_47 [Erwinia phage vB_EamM_Asesino]|uniref:Uncharacterized protein n=1 Tax=Erwinia phage vB_EamM_Asesino TaxID=1883370 RepID=A0A1B2I9Y0_9CAUD|nr:hypothetical protein ASESINO_47 [Erwinia phage vB_EamM_Asesino]ANZ48060.1 hypothetical protein ASESINO_47 [Erwinia phage vB_EamM_Asesino]
MKIEKIRDRLVVRLGDSEVGFNGFRGSRKDQNVPEIYDAKGAVIPRDRIMFMEIERYWSTLTADEKADLFSAYAELELLANEPPEVVRKHAPRLVNKISRYHSAERFKQLYPLSSVWIPENMSMTYDDMSTNYPEAMTYIVSDYYELIILVMLIKPFIPVFLTLGAFPTSKGAAVEMKRKNVYNLTYCMDLLNDTDIMKLPAIPKLRGFLDCVLEKVQRDQSNKGMMSTSLSVLATVSGYGTDMTDEYVMAFAVIRLLSMRLIGAELPKGTMVENNMVAGLFFNVKQEIETGFASKISNQNVLLKQHPENVVFNGERGKINSTDLIQARTTAPIKEYVRTEVFFKDYRRALKSIDIAVPPADVKILIDSIQLNHTSPFYELHEWLIAAALHRFADRRTYKDIDAEAFMCGMGLAQAVYLNYGMPEIAQLLSCEMIQSDLSTGYPIEPIDNEIKIKTDRYYPQAYRGQRNTSETSTLRDSLNLLLREHVGPFFFHLRATPEAAMLLKCEMDIEAYAPHKRIQNMLAEFLLIQARKKVEEVDWFNDKASA